jgi:histidinol-phosphate aminotransferase
VKPLSVNRERRPVAAASYVEALRPYPVVGQEALRLDDPDTALKLDWNESTRRPSAAIVEAVEAYLHGMPMNWYPDVAATALTESLVEYVGAPAECVLSFNGSDGALEYVCRAYVEPGDRVVMVAPTYDNFRVYVEGVGGRVEQFHYQDPVTPNLDELLALPGDVKLIYFVSPNNPTGTVYPVDVVRELLDAHPQTLFVADEAYHEFCGESLTGLITEYPNLLVSRTFSKAFGLAGFRIGYVVAHPSVIGILNRIRVGKSVNALAQVAAVAALENVQDMKEYVADCRWGAALLQKGLRELGLSTIPTPANFIIVRTPDPAGLVDALRKERVYIRNLGHLPGLEGCVRVTVGAAEHCARFLDILARVMGAASTEVPEEIEVRSVANGG